jgi:hypothetical protein
MYSWLIIRCVVGEQIVVSVLWSCRFHNTSSVTNMLTELKWPQLQLRRTRTHLIFFSKIIHHLVVRDSSVVRRHYIFLLEPWDVSQTQLRHLLISKRYCYILSAFEYAYMHTYKIFFLSTIGMKNAHRHYKRSPLQNEELWIFSVIYKRNHS